MRPTLPAFLTLAVLMSGNPAPAQMHKVAKPEQVVRAVGVYEWTGDLKKPDASRLVPVTLFIDGSLQDAGVYLPRPIPFALTPGNEYELEQSGIARGILDLAYATHLQTADSAYEDGWFGYGSYKAPPAPKKETALRPSKNPAVLTSSKDEAHPHLGSKDDPPGPNGKSQPADPTDTSAKKTDDPDRPTMHRRSDTSTASTAPPADTSTSPADTPAPTSAPTASGDADRPTLRRRSPEDAKENKQSSKDVATVTGTGSLNDDPDRPKLQHGGRSSANDSDIPKLVGLPKDLKQMVAVSDASNRPPHDFARPWQDEKEHAAVLARMRELARTQLQAYGPVQPTPSSAATPPSSAPPEGTPPSTATPDTSITEAAPPRLARTPQPHSAPAAPQPTPAPKPGPRPTSTSTSRRKPHQAATPLDLNLVNEDLKGYILSYGGAPTYIYTAQAGTGPGTRYVTLVAQADVNGELQPAVRSVTDETHLDRTPRMRLVDVVDAEASNRASLLFELRSQATRQFALYRVIGSRAEATFTTGTTQ